METNTMTKDSLAEVLGGTDLAEASRNELVQAFGPSFVTAREMVAAAALIVVTDATQVTQMKAARATRLKLREIRSGAENIRKDLKAESLKRGREIDNVAGMIKALCEPEETRLEEAEKFAERAEAARLLALVKSRKILLAPHKIDTTYINLEGMDEASFQQLLESSRLANEAREEAAAKAAAERLAAAQAKQAEDARIRAENERMRLAAVEAERDAKAERDRVTAERAAEAEKARQEREAIEAKTRKERLAADAKLAAERKAREAIEAQQRTAQEAERLKAVEAERARRAEEAAPDAWKLEALAEAIAAYKLPKMTTTAGSAALAEIAPLFVKLAEFIGARSEKIASGVKP